MSKKAKKDAVEKAPTKRNNGTFSITIPDVISRNIIEDCVIPLLEQDVKGEPITIYITTTGGERAAAMCLCDVIERLKSPTTMYLIGYVYSAGMFIAMSGYNNPNVTTYAYPSTEGMMHHGSLNLGGDVEMKIADLKDYMDFNVKKDDEVREYVLGHSSMPGEFYDTLTRKEYWLSAQEMLEFGIIDGIL